MDSSAAKPAITAFPIVGIGASAGGLEALTQLLKHVPADTGMAFVLVQHLDPTHESKMCNLLSRHTGMRVEDAGHGTPVEPNRIYCIRPNTALTLADGALHEVPRSDLRGPHLPIDHLFKSLAEERQGSAIGVILSGTGTDGTLGLEEIKASGGITFAQDEASAKYASMPQSAARSGCVDRVLSPEGIAGELVRIGRHPYLTPAAQMQDAAPAPGEEDDFRRVLRLLRTTVGIDFSAYRDSTIRRRIMRRMMLHTKNDLGEYVRHLETDRGEIEALCQDILINVTSFFREPEAFETLKQRVFPQILETKTASTPIRIWTPGCSTGQEVYSIAIALLEFLENQPVRPQICIFATDLSEAVALRKAREGLYPENIEAEVSAERLRRYFTREDGKYRVNKALRDMCVFAKQNVAADPPFSRMDLISCRNLLIYLAPQLQKRVIPTFHYALNPHGFLMLGASETIGGFGELFDVVDQPARIYAKKLTASRQYPHFRVDEEQGGAVGARGGTPSAATPSDWQREADRVVLNEYAPAGVLVNDSLDVLQFRGHTSPYLAHAAGEPSFNLLKLAREGLYVELRHAVDECRDSNAAVRRTDIRVRGEDGRVQPVDLHVLPVKHGATAERCFLVLFEPGGAGGTEASSADRRDGRGSGDGARSSWLARWLAPAPSARATTQDEAADAREMTRLRQELLSTREYLQSVIEQNDAATEELKSSSEEILSSNEELQSTNDELEIAKEELQSVNEELTTVNEQLNHRNQELVKLNDDFVNLLGSAGVAMLVLGVDLRIRRFTPAAAKLLHLLPGDVGRPLGNLAPALREPDLEQLALAVIDTAQLMQRETQDFSGHWYELCIHPYRTADNRIAGAVLVLNDTDRAKRAQIELLEARDYAEAITETVREPLLVLDGSLHVRSANHAYYEGFGVTPPDTIGRPLHELGSGQWDLPELRQLLSLILPGHGTVDNYEIAHEFETIGRKTMLLNAHRIVRADGESRLILLGFEDITRRRVLESEAQNYMDRLSEADRRKNDFLAMLAHELRNPLAPLRNGVELLGRIGHDATQAPALLAMMQRQVRHMTHLIDDLLDVSRITNGKIELRKQRVELASVIGQAVEACRPLVDAAGQELIVRVAAEPLDVDADPVRLAQVVENLLTNAVKYTERGGRIELDVEAVRGPDAENQREPANAETQVRIRVRDNGIGIAAEVLPKIWDLFMQADVATDRARGGLGIGLALVRSLVQMHGGSVEASSAGPGQGSEFCVYLPLLSGGSAATPDPKPAPLRRKAARRRVLVVDDNIDQAGSLGMLLKAMGHEVRVAHEGPAALVVAAEFRPEVVFLDIGLPGMDGNEVAQRLRKDLGLNRALVVALSGYGTADDRQRSFEAGFDTHLVKPADPARLTQLLADYTAV